MLVTVLRDLGPRRPWTNPAYNAKSEQGLKRILPGAIVPNEALRR